MSKARDIADLLDSAGKVTADDLDVGAIGGRRNLIINGGFDVWQRSTDETGTYFTYKTADRWRHYNGTMSMRSYRVDVSSDTAVPTQYAIGLEVSSATWGLMHKVEYVKAGTYTMSFYIKGSTSGSLKLYDSEDTVNITTSWQRVSKVITVSSSGQFNTFIVKNTPQTFNGTVYLTGVQLELGSVATPFEHRSYGEELALCQRYYRTVSASSIQMHYVGAWGRYYGIIALETPMRADPSVSFGFSYITNYQPGGGSGTSMGASVMASTAIRIESNGSSNGFDDVYMAISDTGNTSIRLDAEL